MRAVFTGNGLSWLSPYFSCHWFAFSGRLLSHVLVQIGISCLLRKTLSRGTEFPTRLHLRQAKTQISLRIHAGRSVSSLSAWRRDGFLATHTVPCEDSDQTVQMHKLIWAFAGRTCNIVVNAVPWPIQHFSDVRLVSQFNATILLLDIGTDYKNNFKQNVNFGTFWRLCNSLLASVICEHKL